MFLGLFLRNGNDWHIQAAADTGTKWKNSLRPLPTSPRTYPLSKRFEPGCYCWSTTSRQSTSLHPLSMPLRAARPGSMKVLTA